MKKYLLIFITLIALGLRLYKLGDNNFIEEENTMLKASAYLYYCGQDEKNCQISQKTSFKNRLAALILNNETKPNLLTDVYLWNFVNEKPTNTHHSRAWPQLYLMSFSYKTFGINEWSSRLIAVLAGSLLIPVGWWLVKSLNWPDSLSLIYIFSLAFSFHLVEISRNNRMYSLFLLMFLLAINQKLWQKPIAAALSFILAYWLHLLALLTLVALAIYSTIWKVKKIIIGLACGLLLCLAAVYWWRWDVFFHYFWELKIKPDWQYIPLSFNSPWPWWINIGLILTQIKTIMKNKQLSWILILILTYLSFLIFFSNKPTAGAYVIHLIPLSWILIIFSLRRYKILLWLFAGLIFCRWLVGFNYLYLGKNGQAQPAKAYRIIKEQFKQGDKIAGIQIRDYYLQSLPDNTELIDLQRNPDFEFNKTGFVVWEKEKTIHWNKEKLALVKNNFQHLAGEGLDNWGVEIYSFGK